MRCAHCAATNTSNGKFCEQCGRPLGRTCASCGAEVSATAKFCGECGTPVDETAASPPTPDPVADGPASDRRFVSVLFADIVGYTSFTEGRDSDEVREMLTEYFDRSRSVIEKFGGVVEKFIGDAVFGVWGTETVREDDAERAVRAGLELVSMVAALGEDLGHEGLELRAGVMSGSTAVGQGGNESTGMIVGDLVNTAARLQGAADPSTVFVGQTTHAVTERSIAYERRGPIEVKGKAEPVEAWRAMRPAARLGTKANARELPFGGRDREMRMLTDWLDGTTAEQRSRLVSITGEAGIGKSRLAREFLQHVDGYADSVYWHHGRSPSYADGSPMWSLAEMVRNRAGIAEDEAPARARTRLRTTLVDFVDDPDERDWIDRWLSGLLGVGELPVGSRSELLAALRSFFQHIAERGTTVLVFEDLHWADDSVVEFISELIDRSTRSPILVITLARPELLRRHPEFGAHQRAAINIALAPLVDDELRAILREHLEGSDTPDDLVERIVRRASGFPLYAAEILRMLVNQGQLVEGDDGLSWSGGEVEQLAIPDTLQSVIGARLDRLEPELRSALQDGAILGTTFQVGALEALAGVERAEAEERLRQLVRLDLLEIVDDVRSPERGQYRFVQGLIQELARDRLSRQDGRVRHLSAAEFYGRNEDPELAGVVAQHLEAAYDLTPPGPERDALLVRAVDGLVAAARRSASLHTDRIALDLFDRALRMAPADERVGAWLLEATRCAIDGGFGGRGLDYLDRAHVSFEEAGDRAGLTQVAVLRADLHASLWEAAKALEAIEPTYLALDDIDDELSLSVAAQAARAYMLDIQEEKSVAAADRALAVSERLELPATSIGLVVTRATALHFLGRPIEGIASLIGAVELSQRIGNAFEAARAANNLMSVYWEIDAEPTRAWSVRLAELSRRTGAREWIRRSDVFAALLAALDGDVQHAAAFVDQELADEDENEIDIAHRRTLAILELSLAIAQGHDEHPVIHERFRQLAGESTDAQTVLVYRELEARYAAFTGDWETVNSPSNIPQLPSNHVTVLIYAAARLADTAAVERLAAWVEVWPAGGIRTSLRRLVAAVELGVSGDSEACAAAFVALLPDAERCQFAQQVAWMRATMIELLGRDHPAAAPVAVDLLAWIDRYELEGYRSTWSHLLPDVVDPAVRAHA